MAAHRMFVVVMLASFFFFFCSQYLYTLKVADQAKADKIAASFPQGLKKEIL